MSHVENLPSKVAASKLLFPLANNLLKSPKLSDNHELLTSITFSDMLSPPDRQLIIQAAINQYSKSSEINHAAVGNWLAHCAKEHAEDFKSSALPLIETMEAEQITRLETITNLTLKVVTN